MTAPINILPLLNEPMTVSINSKITSLAEFQKLTLNEQQRLQNAEKEKDSLSK